jgi:hypothetical protein
MSRVLLTHRMDGMTPLLEFCAYLRLVPTAGPDATEAVLNLLLSRLRSPEDIVDVTDEAYGCQILIWLFYQKRVRVPTKLFHTICRLLMNRGCRTDVKEPQYNRVRNPTSWSRNLVAIAATHGLIGLMHSLYATDPAPWQSMLCERDDYGYSPLEAFIHNYHIRPSQADGAESDLWHNSKEPFNQPVRLEATEEADLLEMNPVPYAYHSKVLRLILQKYSEATPPAALSLHPSSDSARGPRKLWQIMDNEIRLHPTNCTLRLQSPPHADCTCLAVFREFGIFFAGDPERKKYLAAGGADRAGAREIKLNCTANWRAPIKDAAAAAAAAAAEAKEEEESDSSGSDSEYSEEEDTDSSSESQESEMSEEGAELLSHLTPGPHLEAARSLRQERHLPDDEAYATTIRESRRERKRVREREEAASS